MGGSPARRRVGSGLEEGVHFHTHMTKYNTYLEHTALELNQVGGGTEGWGEGEAWGGSPARPAL